MGKVKTKLKPTKPELKVDAGEFIATIERFNLDDKERGSDAGKSRQKIGAYLEKTHLHPQVFSWMRLLLKKAKATEKYDMIASFELVFPIVSANIKSQNPALNLVGGTNAGDEVPEE